MAFLLSVKVYVKLVKDWVGSKCSFAMVTFISPEASHFSNDALGLWCGLVFQRIFLSPLLFESPSLSFGFSLHWRAPVSCSSPAVPLSFFHSLRGVGWRGRGRSLTSRWSLAPRQALWSWGSGCGPCKGPASLRAMLAWHTFLSFSQR